MSRLHTSYLEKAKPALQEAFAYKNVHQIPKLTKVVINAGVGRATADDKHLDTAAATLVKIAGQAPVKTIAKKSVASFKVREGQAIGAVVTLRGERMYEFLDRLISVVLPRIRDFRGISDAAFDKQGNYSLGVPDHTIFPEISFEEAGTPHGLQINIVTTATSAEEAKALLAHLGFPFRRTN